jgi:hypothetical protein
VAGVRLGTGVLRGRHSRPCTPTIELNLSEVVGPRSFDIQAARHTASRQAEDPKDEIMFALKDWHEEVSATARRFQETRVDALRLTFHEVEQMHSILDLASDTKEAIKSWLNRALGREGSDRMDHTDSSGGETPVG